MWNRHIESSCHLERGKSDFVEWAIGKIFGKEFCMKFYDLLATSENVTKLLVSNPSLFVDELMQKEDQVLCYAIIGLDNKLSIVRASDNKVIALLDPCIREEIKMKNGHFLWPLEEEKV